MTGVHRDVVTTGPIFRSRRNVPAERHRFPFAPRSDRRTGRSSAATGVRPRVCSRAATLSLSLLVVLRSRERSGAPGLSGISRQPRLKSRAPVLQVVVAVRDQGVPRDVEREPDPRIDPGEAAAHLQTRSGLRVAAVMAHAQRSLERHLAGSMARRASSTECGYHVSAVCGRCRRTRSSEGQSGLMVWGRPWVRGPLGTPAPY